MSHSCSLSDIAFHIGAELQGDADCQISGLNTLREAGPSELTFLSNQTYRRYLGETVAGAVILDVDSATEYTGNRLVMENPYLGYALASAMFDCSPVPPSGVHPSAVVAASAQIGGGTSIGPNAVLGEDVVIGANSRIGAGVSISDGTVIGDNCRISANVSIYHGVTIGSQVTIHSGAVIGADGFGFAHSEGRWVKIYQLGGVVIGNRVEIGACTTIDRGALEDTVIEDGVILDNHVQIAHNVRIGENTAMAGCSGVSGSTVIGKNCIFAGQSGVVGHVTLCDGVHLTGGTIVTKSLTEPGSYSSGTAFSKSEDWRKNAVRFNQLDDLARRVRQLEKKL
ncbi:MAG TPA: UDP-3-O-(3-hydroxymyristoyl)glucosamine N-acyltransferase [Porticoccus sp.]|nr:UDP-3-O-(3-hydroxymyristoyl)glucosamine N-acyltransferase [Porticoccus sp.]